MSKRKDVFVWIVQDKGDEDYIVCSVKPVYDDECGMWEKKGKFHYLNPWLVENLLEIKLKPRQCKKYKLVELI